MDLALVEQTSEQFLGQWKRLVSTTNWEKGQIIHGWREQLIREGAAGVEYSDEAWSRRVGNVTPQHVGRLRRCFERFYQVRDDYAGLFWSHFQAALDWDDAEMWLEGAVQNGWSISEMRHERAEINGQVAENTAAESDDSPPWDEDAEPEMATDGAVESSLGVVRTPESDECEDDDAQDFHEAYDESDDERSEAPSSAAAVRPFASLPSLPADVNDAFEAYKLCILRHKLAGWQEIARDDLLTSLDALRQLALAPADA